MKHPFHEVFEYSYLGYYLLYMKYETIRGVGHVGGDVDPNFMDSSLVLSTTSWVVSELIRVLHGVSLDEAQEIVSQLSSHKSPAVWVSSGTRRVLVDNLKLNEQILLLIGSNEEPTQFDDLVSWVESSKGYVKRIVNSMHSARSLNSLILAQFKYFPRASKSWRIFLKKAEGI